jgi:drug/metabolite transporter (DMT)-like permease
MQIERHGLATFFKIINISTFAIVSLIWQLKLPNLAIEQQYFLQAIAATITLLLIMLLPSSKIKYSELIKNKFKISSIKSYFYRSFCNAIGVPIWMIALKLIGANEAMAISYLAPIFTSFIAVYYLKEKIAANWILALIFGFFGISIMIYFRPNTNFASEYYLKGLIFAVIASFCFSLYNIICKVQSNLKDNYFAQAFYSFFIATILGAPLAIINWQTISNQEIFWALFSGVIGVLSVIALYLSYNYSTVVKLSPHSYLRIIITIVTLYLVKNEIPAWSTIIAVFFILLGNSLVLFEKSYNKLFLKLRFNNQQ